VRRELTLSPVLRELAICAVARLNAAEYEWLQHAPEFVAAGGTQQQLDALADVVAACDNARWFNKAERAALALTLEMTRMVAVREETFARNKGLIGGQAMVGAIQTDVGVFYAACLKP